MTYSQCGAAADVVFTTLAFLIWSVVSQERPLDHTLRGLCERKSPCHLANAHTHRENLSYCYAIMILCVSRV